MSGLDRRVADLENRVDRNLKIMQKFMDGAAKTVSDVRSRVDKLEKETRVTMARLENNLISQNKVNQKAYDHISALEKKFMKVEAVGKQTMKAADPKMQEKQLMKLVDSALKAYDKNKRR
ncbi:hypothetical protein [Frigidibacter sp. ROC022]|uniref:hypothetical protein n=1 Tax=Frigidibacter sp. ROC022 TaxID=2971796 RepID=UPI00215A888F|nr:hypothetical protein [Frigidibacter sp. ROC022]MCR8723458.1 hypothetical protein [Frigidibacter sp. ROC022]